MTCIVSDLFIQHPGTIGTAKVHCAEILILTLGSSMKEVTVFVEKLVVQTVKNFLADLLPSFRSSADSSIVLEIVGVDPRGLWFFSMIEDFRANMERRRRHAVAEATGDTQKTEYDK